MLKADPKCVIAYWGIGQRLLANPRGGITDFEAAKKACEHMDRIREENRKLFGEADIGVEIIRKMRDSR